MSQWRKNPWLLATCLLFSAFCFLYNGTENLYGFFITIFSVKSSLHLPKEVGNQVSICNALVLLNTDSSPIVDVDVLFQAGHHLMGLFCLGKICGHLCLPPLEPNQVHDWQLIYMFDQHRLPCCLCTERCQPALHSLGNIWTR